MKRKRGNKKGKSKKPFVVGVKDAAPSIDKDEFDSGMEAETPSSTGTDQPDKLVSISSSGPIDKTPGNLVYGLAKVKIKTSKALDSQLTCSDAPTQSDTDKSSPQVGLEKQVVSEKIEANANSLPEINRGVLGTQSKKVGSIKIKSRAFSSSSLSPCNNAGVAQGETIHQELPRRDPQHNKQQLNAALEVIKKIMKMDAAEPFNVPVNPIALGIPDYFDVIDTPMDFGTICSNLENGVKYMNSADVLKDVQYIWENCFKYNNKGDCIMDLMKWVKKNFAKYWAAAGLYSEQTQGITGTESIQATDVAPSTHGKMPLKGGQLNRKTRKRHGTVLGVMASSASGGSKQQTSSTPQQLSSTPQQELADGGSKQPTSSENKKKQEEMDKKAKQLQYMTQDGKMMVTVLVDGSVVGPWSGRWSTRVGDLVRSYIPISYEDWRVVPDNYKDDVWNALMVRFELDVEPEVARPLMEKRFGQKFRTHKNNMRYFLPTEGHPGVLPEGVDPNVWRLFCENESKAKKKSQNIQNAKNRTNLEYSHTLGRRTYAALQYELVQSNPKQELTRVDTWLAGHEDKMGNVLNSAKLYYDKVKDAVEKRKSESGEGSSKSQCIENDELIEVFGKEKKGGVRAVCPLISKKQLTHLGVANAKLKQKKKANDDVYALKEDIIYSVNRRFEENNTQIMGAIQSLVDAFNAQNEKCTPITLISEHASNTSLPRRNLSQNLDNVFASVSRPFCVTTPSPTNNPKVILLDRYNEELAKGYVVTDATKDICHGKRVGVGERKVYVEEVMKPDARLFDAPQGGQSTFADLVLGGYLIWLDCWLKYV